MFEKENRNIKNRMKSGHRYMFQNQEADNEFKGFGNSYNYKYRMHDSRLGRFFAVDPLTAKYPHNSPYAFSENRLLDGVELEGLEHVKMTSAFEQKFGTVLKLNREIDAYLDMQWNTMLNHVGEYTIIFGTYEGDGGITEDLKQVADDYQFLVKNMNKLESDYPSLAEDMKKRMKVFEGYFNQAGMTVDEILNSDQDIIGIFIGNKDRNTDTPENTMRSVRTIFHEIIEHANPLLSGIPFSRHHSNAVDYDENQDHFTDEEKEGYEAELSEMGGLMGKGALTDYDRAPSGSTRFRYNQHVQNAVFNNTRWSDWEQTSSTTEDGYTQIKYERQSNKGEKQTRTKIEGNF